MVAGCLSLAGAGESADSHKGGKVPCCGCGRGAGDGLVISGAEATGKSVRGGGKQAQN